MRKTYGIVVVAAALAWLPRAADAQDAGTSADDQPSTGDVEPSPAPPANGAPVKPASPSEPSPQRAPAQASPRPADNALFPSPSLDAQSLEQQGDQRPDARRTDGSVTTGDIFAEDWWSHARPIFEFHGYFRTRAELFHNFSLGRRDAPNLSLYPQPIDNQYTSVVGAMPGTTYGPGLCRRDETDAPQTNDPAGLRGCRNKTQAGANLRFRLNPELHISDNLRINSQLDILDNVVLGSTPEGYAIGPAQGAGYQVLGRSGYLANGYLDNTQVPPEAGVNGLSDSLRVKRAWAEYTTPVGEVRFGRMPNHWGLGMVANSGDGYDDDYQSTVDRLMFASGVKLLDLVIAGMWDFPNEGALGSAPLAGGQAYDRAQLDDVNQWGLIVMRNKSPELTKLELSRGNLVLNTGVYVTLRKQLLANDQSGDPGDNVPGADPVALTDVGFARRDLTQWLPDLWLQLLYKKFRFELEAAAVIGSVESTSVPANNNGDFVAGQTSERNLRQFGFALELEQKLVEDRLRLRFKSGWGSGDPDAFDPNSVGNLVPGADERQINDDTISTFRFNPAYRIDLILNRNILQRIQGTYYFNPSLDYDFSREANGQRIGGGINVVWTRASEFVQTPGHDTDLGLELNGSLYFQSKDGALNDEPSRAGGFFAQLQYGILFPLAGMSYQAVTKSELNVDTSSAQVLRLYLGVLF
jgi:uncharacterized protein (TIGR04551 family)